MTVVMFTVYVENYHIINSLVYLKYNKLQIMVTK